MNSLVHTGNNHLGIFFDSLDRRRYAKAGRECLFQRVKRREVVSVTPRVEVFEAPPGEKNISVHSGRTPMRQY